MSNEPTYFWITNISNRNISLYDLNLTIKAYSSVNLLDKKHYTYSLHELQKSATSGSLYKKRDKLIIRKFAPEIIQTNIAINYNDNIPSRKRSTFNIKEDKYEELEISDEEFAKENAEIAD